MLLVIDLFGCNTDKLEDPHFLGELLDMAPGALQLTVTDADAAHTWRTYVGSVGEAWQLQLTDGSLEIFTRVMFAQAWVSLFRLEDFDRDAVTAWFVAELEAESADLQVIQRGPAIRAPRPGPSAPWMRTGRPAPEPAPEESSD